MATAACSTPLTVKEGPMRDKAPNCDWSAADSAAWEHADPWYTPIQSRRALLGLAMFQSLSQDDLGAKWGHRPGCTSCP